MEEIIQGKQRDVKLYFRCIVAALQLAGRPQSKKLPSKPQ
jgi:hypothetical protein